MVDDEGPGELDQAQVVLGLLLVADAEFAEAVMPTVRAFDHPPPRRVAGGRRGDGNGRLPAAALAGGMHHVAARLSRLVGLGVVEALIPAPVLGVPGGRGGPRGDPAVEDGFRPLHRGPGGRAEDGAQRRPPSVAQDVPLGAPLAPIGRVRARRSAAEGGKGPSRCRSLASSSRSGVRQRSAATAQPTGGSTRPAGSIPGSGHGPWSRSRTPVERPSTGNRSAGRTGSRPAPAGTVLPAGHGCPAPSRVAAARGSPPRGHPASARWSAPHPHHNDSPSGTSSHRGAPAHRVPFFG